MARFIAFIIAIIATLIFAVSYVVVDTPLNGLWFMSVLSAVTALGLYFTAPRNEN